MASSIEFVQYVADQMRGAGEITYRKMFGEYGIYCDGKIFGVICEDQLFIKKTEKGQKLWPDLEEGSPYQGAKPHFLIEDIDDSSKLTELVVQTCRELTPPKPKKKKASEKPAKKEKALKSEKSEKKLDYKKEFPDLYLPKKPMVIEVPKIVFIQVEGKGNPNTSESYKNALEILYGLSFGIKMNLKFHKLPEDLLKQAEGGSEKSAFLSGNYVVPPLEGLWWTEETAFDGKNITDKDAFCWISMIRQPEMVTEEIFTWAKEDLKKKKPELDLSGAKLVHYQEGLCCQVLHIGPYDDEPATIEALDEFVKDAGYESDFTNGRYHHEIYLSDPRRTASERLKTVIRHPVKKSE